MCRPLVCAALCAALCAAFCAASCGDNLTIGPAADAAAVDAAAIDDAAIDAPLPDAADPFRPTRLAETGLYEDFEGRVIAADLIEYVPQFELWSDSAEKRRWVFLPANMQIDSTDMNFWIYPEGTKIWKEFSRGGLVVETRLYWKQGPTRADWRPFAFAWNAAQDDAVAIDVGATDALGTGHDIPQLFACSLCHTEQPDFVLGYSAIQLDGDKPGHKLADLVSAGRLTVDPPGAGPEYFPLPGGAIDRDALGYMHGNCGGCHFDGSGVQNNVPLELRLDVGRLSSVAETGAYVTAVGVAPTLALAGATSIIEPGDPALSSVHIRMESTANPRMPPVGSEEVDASALAAIDAWINVVPPP